jgi:surface protein
MEAMFDTASSFNADLSKWDVSSVIKMGVMFGGGGII